MSSTVQKKPITCPWMGKELEYNGEIRMGEKGARAKVIQEWLSLHGQSVAIDGDFGPATELAVKRFQKSKRLRQDGVVGKKTFEALIAPMNRVLSVKKKKESFGKAVVSYAKQHLREHPLEVGGQNRGPWVRLYMKGNEGKDWPWCMGFVSFILRQAAESLGKVSPLAETFSCDAIAADAKKKGLFIGEKDMANLKKKAGSIFLVRKTDTDWTHAGIVTAFYEQAFETVEGNTNDAGEREGYEVCRRIRGYKGVDFVRVG